MRWTLLKKNFFLGVGVCVLSLGCLLSCGLEEIYYLDNISASDYSDLAFATVKLPGPGSDGYANFTNFIIYYRIYISSETFSGAINTPSERRRINPYLDNNYNYFYPLTNIADQTINTSNLVAMFYQYGFYKLALEEGDIDTVLGGGSLGRILEFNFRDANTRSRPKLILNGNAYTMLRATEGPNVLFNPKPEDRYFYNDPSLYDKANANNTINADVAANNTTSGTMYTCVLMYIAAQGMSSAMPPATTYSKPTFVGIFKLPQP